MGTLLALSVPARAFIITCLVATFGLTGLGSCSSEKAAQPSLSQVAVGIAKARLKQRRARVEKAGKVKKPAVTRAQMEQLARPVVFASVPRLGTALPSIQVAQNGPTNTYLGADHVTITLTDGMITATRGLPVDLIAQELSLRPKQIFNAKAYPTTYKRSQRHLTGAGTLSTLDYACAIIPATEDEILTVFETSHTVRQFTELCKNKKRAFQNSYWVEQETGQIWQSHQSISQAVGHVVIQQVVK